MSTADAWELTVPEGDDELLAALRRHGVHAGQRLRVVEVDDAPQASTGGPSRPRFGFIGMIKDGPTDASTNMDAYLSEGFGRS